MPNQMFTIFTEIRNIQRAKINLLPEVQQSGSSSEQAAEGGGVWVRCGGGNQTLHMPEVRVSSCLD